MRGGLILLIAMSIALRLRVGLHTSNDEGRASRLRIQARKEREE
jgi:hypothetical protein